MRASSLDLVTRSTDEKLSYRVVQERTLIGKILGNRYRVLREIGSGGMAWVYLAEDNKDNQLVAAKILYPQFGEDLAYIQRFNREAKLASSMTDPHIVRVLDYGADRDVYYLIMEYIEGQDLRTTLNSKGPFPWKEALEVIDQLATALEHAHRHGVVHRDIKPQNMMLNDDGLLKVLDFGIARIPTLPSLTQSGFIGSPYYVSPEQAMGEEVDIRSDIYSSGIVLYELLSGSIPFDAKSPWSIISKHIANEPPPIELPEGDVPANVGDLLKRMVAKRPRDRFQTPSMLRQAIAAVLAGKPVPDHSFDTQPVVPFDPALLAESLYQRALDAMKVAEWARAADLLNQTLTLDPAHPEARQKLAEAEQEAFLISLYNAAKRAMKKNQWEEAINNLIGIIEIEPNFEDTGKLLVEARRALEIENGRQLVITRYNEGMAFFEARRWSSAIEAFQDVKRLSPGYQRVDQLLAQAERFNNPTLGQKLTQTMAQNMAWRWGLIAMGLVTIFVLVLAALGNLVPSAAEDNQVGRDQLKLFYEEAQQAIASGNQKEAVALLDQILKEDPDYADAASLRRELAATPTASPTASPTATLAPTSTSTPAPTLTPTADALALMLNEAQAAIDGLEWSKAIEILTVISSRDAAYQKAQVVSLLCDAYAARGLETLGNIASKDKQTEVKTALADFEAGAKACPRRTDLRDQAERATAYLEALDTPPSDPESLIRILTPVVAVEPDYAGGDAKNLLYTAYLTRGDTRRESAEIVGALSDYEAALGLNVDDPSTAQTRRAELLLSFSQQPAQPTPQPFETKEPAGSQVESSTPTPEPAPSKTPEAVALKYGEPGLVEPADDAFFAGRLTKVFLEWEPVGQLASDEYYDLTIQYIFGNDFVYWGTATTETRVQIPPDIGVGRAGGDRFRWYVTVRKANTAAFSKNNIDLPVSLQSKIRTFVWVP
ncbi:MAG: protein kinase [Anaerolineales bacterium]|nr:protein kinase [Anaerolineales bacterium]